MIYNADDRPTDYYDDNDYDDDDLGNEIRKITRKKNWRLNFSHRDRFLWQENVIKSIKYSKLLG